MFLFSFMISNSVFDFFSYVLLTFVFRLFVFRFLIFCLINLVVVLLIYIFLYFAIKLIKFDLRFVVCVS